MKNSKQKIPFKLILLLFVMPGCYRDDTNYFQDAEAPGLSIFSNTSNNIMSCLVDGKPWRTHSRTFSVFSRPSYEIYISKESTNTVQDTLHMEWRGFYLGNSSMSGSIMLKLPVAKNFGFNDLSGLHGKRIAINNATGYFATSIANLNSVSLKGQGNIYFHSAQFDSISPNSFQGRMSGLFEADFNSFKIAKGRFDHTITPDQVRL